MDARVGKALGVEVAGVAAVETEQTADGLVSVQPVSAATLAAQVHGVLAAGDVSVIKLGALGTAELVETVTAALAQVPNVPVVWDPVAEASRTAGEGVRLLDEDALPVARSGLLPRVSVLTPNLPEASWFAGRSVRDYASMANAAERILQLGPRAVLVKGGHLPESERIYDLWQLAGQDPEWWESPRVPGGGALHGTGCALSSALAAHLALGHSATEAALAARGNVLGWMRAAIDGSGDTVFRPAN